MPIVVYNMSWDTYDNIPTKTGLLTFPKYIYICIGLGNKLSIKSKKLILIIFFHHRESFTILFSFQYSTFEILTSKIKKMC